MNHSIGQQLELSWLQVIAASRYVGDFLVRSAKDLMLNCLTHEELSGKACVRLFV